MIFIKIPNGVWQSNQSNIVSFKVQKTVCKQMTKYKVMHKINADKVRHDFSGVHLKIKCKITDYTPKFE